MLIYTFISLFGRLLLMNYSFIFSYIPLYNALLRKYDYEPYFYYLGRILIVLLWDPPLLFNVRIDQSLGKIFLHDGNGHFLSILDEKICISRIPLEDNVPELLNNKVFI